MFFKKAAGLILIFLISGGNAMYIKNKWISEKPDDIKYSFVFPEDGFSGSMVLPPRAWKSYNQPFTVHIIYGKGEKHYKAVSVFDVENLPSSVVYIGINGVDDSSREKNLISLKLNGKEIYKGISPFENCTYTRALGGRKTFYIKVKRGILKKGKNNLEIENLSSCLDKSRLPWIAFDQFEILSSKKLNIEVKTDVRIAWGETPLSVCLYPAYVLDYTITAPYSQPVITTINVRTGKGFEKYIGRNYSVVFKLPDTIKFERFKRGAEIEKYGDLCRVKMGRVPKVYPGFLIRTSQKGFLIIAKGKPGNEYRIKTWIEFDGDKGKYFPAEYTLKVIEKIKPRQNPSPFSLNTWIRSGVLAEKEEVRKLMLGMFRNLGVSSNWAGPDPEIVDVLQKNGIKAIVQRNWYQNSPSIVKKDKNAVSYTVDGKPHPSYVRPYYQYNRGIEFDKTVLSKWREDAKIPAWACGTDFEGMTESLSFDSESIKMFQKITGIKESNPEIIWKKYYPEWVRFRGWESSQIMKVANEEIKKVKPDKKWVVFSDGGDLTTYWWHKPIPTNTAAIAKYADMMCTSLYYYDNAGAIKSIQPFVQMLLSAMPVEKAAPTLIFMVYPVENEYFGFLKQPAWSVKQSTILLALNRIKTVSWFAGFQMDGVYLKALSEAVNFIDRFYPVIEKGELLPDLVDVKMKKVKIGNKPFFDVSGSPYFYDACRWLPQKDLWFTKVVYFYRDSRYVFLANHTSSPLDFELKATGYHGRKWDVKIIYPEVKKIGVIELGGKAWSKPFQVRVSPHEIAVVKMKRTGEE